MRETKVCESCGKLVRRSPSHIRGRVYCSKVCSNLKKNVGIPNEKTCENCGITFSKQKRETWEYWKTKKYCSHECYSACLVGKKNPNISATLKKLWASDLSFQQKMAGRPSHSLETRQKIGAAFKGRKLTYNHKQRISQAIKGENHPFYGRTHSQETKKKISENRKGIPLSEKHKQHLSELFTGRKLSEATRKKLSDISKYKWANDPEYVTRLLDGLSGSKGRTSLEQKVADVLTEIGVEFEEQFIISRSIVDFYIHNGKKIIEADGERWHSAPEKKAKDRRRDSFLMDNGYRILRLSETEINNNPLPKIMEFLNK
ncbi:NUMOD3 domain-containing DNA-binding protein [Neobacillus sp. Marseille-QA0830]